MVQGEGMKLNKLKKKCVSEFFAQHEGTHKTAEEVGAKFDKKIKKKKYRILKDKVLLIPDDQEEEKQAEDQSRLVREIALPFARLVREIAQQVSIYILCLYVCLFVCLFVCLYPINVKTAEPIGSKFCVGTHVTLGKV